MVTADDPFIFEFDGLSLVGPTLATNDRGGALIHAYGDVKNPGAQVLVQFYQDSLIQSPRFENVFVLPDAAPRFGSFVQFPALWLDFQGVMQVSMLTGTMHIDRIDVQVLKDGLEYGETFNFPIPLPAAFWLLISGLLALVPIVRRGIRSQS